QTGRCPGNARARRRSVCGDARSKNESIKPAKGGGQHTSKEPDTIDEIVERECCFRIGTFLEFAHVIAEPRKPFQSGFLVEKILDRCGAHSFFRNEVEHHARIKLSRPRAHRQAVERGQSERALYTP